MPVTTSRISRRSFLGRAATFVGALALPSLTRSVASAAVSAPKLSGVMDLTVAFEIIQQGFGRYNRPYVAVWIEDGSGRIVRPLSVWAQTGFKGQRYLEHLTRWSRLNSDVLSTVSGPTRNPGKYSLSWDGKDSKGVLLPQGEYYVNIESAREHGPYALIREKVKLGSAALSSTGDQSGDIGNVTLEYKKRA